MEKQKPASTSRRDVLKLAVVGAPAAAATVAVGAEPAVAAAPQEGAGLRKTEHVRKYLESARF